MVEIATWATYSNKIYYATRRDAFHTQTTTLKYQVVIFIKERHIRGAIAAFYEDEHYLFYMLDVWMMLCWRLVLKYLDVALAYHDHNSY